MSRTAMVNALYRRKANLMNEKHSAQTQISALNTEIERLRSASNKLSGQIASLRQSQSKVQNLTVNGSQWKGEKRETFGNHYETYKTSVSRFVSKTKDKKEQLDEEIRQAESRMTTYETQIKNLTVQITHVERQIEQTRRS